MAFTICTRSRLTYPVTLSGEKATPGNHHSQSRLAGRPVFPSPPVFSKFFHGQTGISPFAYRLGYDVGKATVALHRFFLFQREKELQSVSAECRTGIDVAAMEQYGILYDGQSKPRPANLAAASLVHPVKTLENPPQMFRIHSHSIVAETEIVRLFVLGIANQIHMCPDTGIGDSVVHQITENGIQQG